MKLIRNELTILAILFLGLLLRIYNLGSESLWLDEGISIRLAKSNLAWILKYTAQDVHPPLYYIILHYWINLFGDSEFSTRFLSVIFGFLAIFMIYRVGSLIFDKYVGTLSSLILALSVYNIRYSQEVRTYSLVALLTLLSMYFFIKLLETRNLGVLVGYVISSIFLIYSHYFGIFIIIAQNFYFVTLYLLSKGVYKPDLRRWIFLQVTLIVLFMPWVNIIIKSKLLIQKGSWLPVPSIFSIIYSFVEYSGSPSLFYLFLTVPVFVVITYSVRLNWNSTGKRIYLLSVWLFVPIVLSVIISKFSVPIYSTKYSIGASLAMYILIAEGVKKAGSSKFFKAISKPLRGVIIGLIIVFSLISIGAYYKTVDKEQWREVAYYIDRNAHEGDLLLFSAGYNLNNVFDYYSKRDDLIKKPVIYWGYVNNETILRMVANIENHNRVWLVLSHDIFHDPNGLIKKKLAESYDLSYYKKYVGIQVYLFEKYG